MTEMVQRIASPPSRRVRLICLAALSSAALLTGLGCRGAIAGNYKLERAIPSREHLALDDVQFRRDGAYAATVTRDGKTMREEGRYGFDGFNLWLEPSAGGRREFGVVIKMKSLELRQGDRKVILRKE